MLKLNSYELQKLAGTRGRQKADFAHRGRKEMCFSRWLSSLSSQKDRARSSPCGRTFRWYGPSEEVAERAADDGSLARVPHGILRRGGAGNESISSSSSGTATKNSGTTAGIYSVVVSVAPNSAALDLDKYFIVGPVTQAVESPGVPTCASGTDDRRGPGVELSDRLRGNLALL